MSIWRQITHGLRVLAHRKAADRELSDEVQHYFEQTVAANTARGLSPEEARRAAQLEFGSKTMVREQVRGYGWENVVETFLADLRYSVRQLRSNPGFAVVSVLTLALGIGASTAIFSAVNPILFESLPYPHAERIVALWDFGPGSTRLEGTFGTYRELASRSRTFDSLAVIKRWQPTVTSSTEPERLDGQRVSNGYFRVLGVAPKLGRDFEVADDRINGPNVAILSDALWRRRFAGDASIVGREITLDGNRYTVVGVMPAGFENVIAPATEIWAALQYDMSQGRAWGHHLRMLGRTRDGVGIDQVRREIETIGQTPEADFQRPSWASLQRGLTVTSLQDDATAAVKPALLAVLGAVFLLLLIACVNVTNLLLARNARRHGEFTMRAALGAARSRLIRQMLTESVLLATLGGALAMVVAEIGVGALVSLGPSGLPRVGAIQVDGSVFGFALGVSTLVGLIVGVVPALYLSRSNLQVGLGQTSRRTTARHRLTRAGLVVCEVAVAIVLLVNAGLLLRSLERLFAINPGFDASNVLTMQVQASGPRFADNTITHEYFARVLNEVRRVPGVTSAGFSSQLPMEGSVEEYGMHFEGDDAGVAYSAFKYDVSPDYFETIRIPVIRGRGLTRDDLAGAPLVALISESLAKLKFQDQDPIGQRADVPPNEKPYTIVGVVGDVRQASLAASRADAVYIPKTQVAIADRALWLVVRSKADVILLAPAIKAAIWSVDKDQPIVRVAAMESLVAATAAERRFVLILFETFALVALTLAAIGIYGVLSSNVSERTREIGVRSALGASRGSIRVLIVRQGMTLTILGVTIGICGAVMASRAIVTLLFGISRLDVTTYVGVVALLLAVSGIACWLPAWRASRVDPSVTLRAE